MFIQSIVPQDVIDSNNQEEYIPWYVGHDKPEALTQEVICEHWEGFASEGYPSHSVVAPEPDDVMGNFMDYLEERGYTVFDSAHQVVTVERDDLCYPNG